MPRSCTAYIMLFMHNIGTETTREPVARHRPDEKHKNQMIVL